MMPDRVPLFGLELADKQQIVSLLKQRSELFSGISLTIEKPYKLGDEVLQEEGIEGQVVQIHWWYTHLLGIFSSVMNEPPRASFMKHG